MSYKSNKESFDKTAARIAKASKGKLTHRQAANRLRQAINKTNNKQ